MEGYQGLDEAGLAAVRQLLYQSVVDLCTEKSFFNTFDELSIHCEGFYFILHNNINSQSTESSSISP